MTVPADRVGWPTSLRPGALRWARASRHYEDTVAFYRDLVRLPVVDGFTGSFGEDGTIFGLPDTTVQMEIVRGGPATVTGTFDQLVLYLDGVAAVADATSALTDAGLAPEPQQHPYWAANGAVTYADPDGRGVVFAPWVFGRDPDPVNRTVGSLGQAARPPVFPVPDHQFSRVHVAWYDGDRAALRGLFGEAEDSLTQLDEYISRGRVLVARKRDEFVGHLQLVESSDREIEVKNMAVLPWLRGTGIGRTLVAAAVDASRRDGYTGMVVATAAADIGNLRFYQRCGFRFTAVERDAFTSATGYPDPIAIDGIPLRDRVWLSQDL
jgi:GNAT superfamily N-acetyltransferase